MPSSAPAVASESQCTWRYVRLQAMPAITSPAARNHSGRLAPSLVKRSTSAIAVAPRVRGVAGGKRRAVRVDQPTRRTRPVDECLDRVRGERGHRLRHGERNERRPAPRDEQSEPDQSECQAAPEAPAEGIEDEGDVREDRRLDVAHELGPAAVERERACRDEHRAEQDESDQEACPAHCPAGDGPGTARRCSPRPAPGPSEACLGLDAAVVDGRP